MTRPPISELDRSQNTKPPIDSPPENCLGPGPKATQLTITANEANTTIPAARDIHVYRPNRVARGAKPAAANASPVSATIQPGTWSVFGGDGIHPIPTAMITEPAVQKAMAYNHAKTRDEPDDPFELALTMCKVHSSSVHESIVSGALRGCCPPGTTDTGIRQTPEGKTVSRTATLIKYE
jgi:hypothetical protein